MAKKPKLILAYGMESKLIKACGYGRTTVHAALKEPKDIESHIYIRSLAINKFNAKPSPKF